LHLNVPQSNASPSK
jgi:hypothetical protein